MNAFESVRPRAELRPSPPLRRQPTPRLSSYIVVGDTPIDVLQPMISARPSKWRAGPPPHVGWWLTKTDRGRWDTGWRWWWGTYWSWPVSARATPAQAAQGALVASMVDTVVWCHDWPKNARVQRINPESAEVSGAA